MLEMKMPQKKPNEYSGMLQTAGGIVGSMYGGPVGGAAGSQLGKKAGDAGSTKPVDTQQTPESPNQDAIGRRMAASDGSTQSDNAQLLHNSITALQDMPDGVTQKYGPQL